MNPHPMDQTPRDYKGRNTQPLRFAACLIAFAVLPFLTSCQAPEARPASKSIPAPNEADAKAIQGFLKAYGRQDLEGMMAFLDDDAVFRGTAAPLSKPQIRDFFRMTFQKHPNLRVEVGSLTEVQGAIHVRVKVLTDIIWADTWIFEMRNHRIHAYSLASGKR